MKICLNQIFTKDKDDDYVQWKILTGGTNNIPLNPYKGMPYFTEINGRIPIINFHINPFKEEEEQTPWRDLIFQDEGRVIYYGDNKNSSHKPHETFGNKKVLEIVNLYSSKDAKDRMAAPPIIVTKTIRLKNKTGFRKFIGIGIIRNNPVLVQQYEKSTDKIFSNYQFEVTLFNLSPEEYLDWDWIDERRNPNLSLEETFKRAPTSWKEWVTKGDSCLPKVRLRIKSYRILSESEQKDLPPQNQKILDDLLNKHYPNPTKDGIRFEAMASFISELFFQNYHYLRGWITEGSGDRGVDFVGRLDIGQDDFSRTSLIVLGQSKRYKNPISGERLTRVASRMTRGYIGVVVTLDTFTCRAQEEIKDDKLPIILINGKKVSELILNYINKTNKTLSEIVKEQDEWSLDNLKSERYESILIS